LQDQEATYSVGRWEQDFRKKEKLMNEVMCEHPFILGGKP
jgi:hypothetical protein